MIDNSIKSSDMNDNSIKYRILYQLKYFPVPKDYKKEYKIATYDTSSPSIVNTIKPNIYQVKDSALFYTDINGKYNILTYFFEYKGCSVRLVKYKSVESAEYQTCIKSDKLIDEINIINPEFNTEILMPVSFDMYKYQTIQNPKYLVKKDGITVDILENAGKVYMCIKNYCIEIGKCDLRLFLKGELMNNKVYIFDAYIFDEILDIPYIERIKDVDLTKIELSSDVSIEISNIHNTFEEAYEERKHMENDGIIIQPEFEAPLKWKPAANNTVDVLVEDDLYLAVKNNGIKSFKVIENRDFDRRMIGEYRSKYLGEIIEVGVDGSFHKNRFDKNKPNSLITYKSLLNPTTIISPEIITGKDPLYKEYKLSYELEKIYEKYIHGQILETGANCINYKKIDNFIVEDNIIQLLDTSSIMQACIKYSTIRKSLKDLKVEDKFDTLLILDDTHNKFDSFDDFLNKADELMTECGHIIIHQENSKLKEFTHSNFQLLECARWEGNEICVISRKITVKPLFIFVVGVMGSGKSSFIRKIRNYIHPLHSINVITTDDLVTSTITYQLYNNEKHYKMIRETIDKKNDEKINQLIKDGQTIILETTHVNEDYANDIKKTHDIVIIVCNTSLGEIKNNIEARNVRNIRKTVFSPESYEKLQHTIPKYKKIANEYYEFDMNKGDFIKY
jgi:hypothetical protein